ncbi:hypothetical protein ACQPW1_10245 [Nocardia sp. CA-128927]|uniref:hypothetical protein n=1 Tax=Nocardia sp. CA-128927 TaxID=3239975 RepID=UPI003D974856
MLDLLESLSVGVVDGFEIKAAMYADLDASPDHYDPEVFDQADLESFGDSWQFVGVEVSARRAGFTLGHASIWSCEYGLLAGKWFNPLTDHPVRSDDWVNGHGESLLREALDDAHRTLVEVNTPTIPVESETP